MKIYARLHGSLPANQFEEIEFKTSADYCDHLQTVCPDCRGAWGLDWQLRLDVPEQGVKG